MSWMKSRGSIPGRSKRLLLAPQCQDQFWGPSSLTFNGCGALPMEMKWLIHKAHHTHPFSAKIMYQWSYTSTPTTAFMTYRRTNLPLCFFTSYKYIWSAPLYTAQSLNIMWCLTLYENWNLLTMSVTNWNDGKWTHHLLHLCSTYKHCSG
jgi:hypothetical protein